MPRNEANEAGSRKFSERKLFVTDLHRPQSKIVSKFVRKIKTILLYIFLIIVLLLVLLSWYSHFAIRKSAPVTYIHHIPGSIMATTIPPFGIFIEEKYKNEGDGHGTVLAHEKIHWLQYQERGLWGFYRKYIFGWLKHGRLYNELEIDARNRSK